MARIVRGVTFDLGKTRTGIACWNDREPYAVDHITYSHTSSLGALVDAFRRDLPLWTHYGRGGVDWLAYERRLTGAGRAGGRHLEIHYAMVAILHERAHHMRVPIFDVATASAKKALTGNGRADKDDMLVAARVRYPTLRVRYHDEADAIAVGLWVVNNAELDTDDNERAPI